MKDRSSNTMIFVSFDDERKLSVLSDLADAFHSSIFNVSGMQGDELFLLFLSARFFVCYISRTAFESISVRLEAYLDDTGDQRPIYIVDNDGWMPPTKHGNIHSFTDCSDGQLLAVNESFRNEREHERTKQPLSNIYPNRTVFVAIQNIRLRQVYLAIARRYGMHGYDLKEIGSPRDWSQLFDCAAVFVMDRWTCMMLENEIAKYLKIKNGNTGRSTLFYLAQVCPEIAAGYGRIVTARLYPLRRLVKLFRDMRRQDRSADRFIKRCRN